MIWWLQYNWPRLYACRVLKNFLHCTENDGCPVLWWSAWIFLKIFFFLLYSQRRGSAILPFLFMQAFQNKEHWPFIIHVPAVFRKFIIKISFKWFFCWMNGNLIGMNTSSVHGLSRNLNTYSNIFRHVIAVSIGNSVLQVFSFCRGNWVFLLNISIFLKVLEGSRRFLKLYKSMKRLALIQD